MAKSTSKKRATKPDVVSFRLTGAQSESLSGIFEKDAAVGVKSTNMLARKIVSDYIAGRLKYLDPKDKLVDLDLI